MSRLKKKLVDITPDVLTGNGIFSAMDSLDVPWSSDMDGITLDMEYFYNISGQKYYSPLVEHILNGAETLTAANITTLASLAYKMNIIRWCKLYATLSLEYDPISNYDMTETETTQGTNGNTRQNTGTQTTAHTGTVGNVTADTTTETNAENGQNDIYGFNSSTAQGDTAHEINTTVSTTESITATRTDNLTDQTTNNLSQTDSGTRSENRTLTRTGNIGVTTSQQMIESERQLYIWQFFYDVVFPDVDRVLTIATYGNRWNIDN